MRLRERVALLESKIDKAKEDIDILRKDAWKRENPPTFIKGQVVIAVKATEQKNATIIAPHFVFQNSWMYLVEYEDGDVETISEHCLFDINGIKEAL